MALMFERTRPSRFTGRTRNLAGLSLAAAMTLSAGSSALAQVDAEEDAPAGVIQAEPSAGDSQGTTPPNEGATVAPGVENLSTPAAPALTATSLAAFLNASEICTPLQLDLNDVSGLLGFSVPSFLPIDTNLRWNQNAHEVERFVSDGVTFEADILVGCRPSSSGSVLERIGLTAERLRVPGEAFCAGAIGDAGTISAADCTIEGRIVPLVSRTIDLEGRLETALTAEPEAEPQTETESETE